jgi:hypothetical protein
MRSQYITLAETSANSEQASGWAARIPSLPSRNCAFCRKGAASFAERPEVREGAPVAAATAPFIDATQRIAAGR